MAPSVFIPIAEDVGLITDLTYKLLRQACLDAKAWPSHLSLSLNISPGQLKDRWLPERLLGILTETGFSPRRLEVEVTEDALVNDFETAKLVLSSLRNLGVRIVLDDFGTGYSSLYHLRELRFDKLKIDRSFIQTMYEDGENLKLVGAIVRLGHSLGLPTTAEGVEDVEHMSWLAQNGCEFAQGYLFGKPMPAAEVGSFLGAAQGSSERQLQRSSQKRVAQGV